jgi:outer membrane protein assembly factor BamA
MRFSVLYIILFAGCISLQAQVSLFIQCNDINYNNTNYLNRKIELASVTEAKQYLEILLKSSQQQGHLAACFNTLSITDTSLFALFLPGPVILFTEINFSNISSAALKKSGTIKMSKNKEIQATEIVIMMDKIVSYYENNGYPFARVFLDSMLINGNNLKAVLRGDTGKQIVIDTIRNTGNLEIEPEVLFSILGVFPGELYNEMKIQNISQRIQSKKFIREKSPPVVSFTDDGVVITVTLDKRPVNSFDGIVGFMPDYQNEGKIFVTGDLNLSLTNALMLSENLKLQWRQPLRGTQDLKTSLDFPWLIYVPLGFSWDFYLLKRDSSYITTEHKPVLFYSGNNSMKTGLYVNYFRSRLISSDRNSNPEQLPQFCDMNITSPGLKFEYNSGQKKTPRVRDFHASLDLSAGKKVILKNLSFDDQLYQDIQLNSFRFRIETDLSVSIPFGRNNIIFIRNVSGAIQAPQLFQNELFMLGGLNRLRGFEENRFFASLFTLQTLEYRFMIDETSMFILFADEAYMEKNIRNSFTVLHPIGVGAGLTLETGAGVFSLLYAIGKTDHTPFDFSSSKIHFGYLVRF